MRVYFVTSRSNTATARATRESKIMNISGIKKNGMNSDYPTDKHVVFSVDGAEWIEWLNDEGACVRCDSNLSVNSDFTDDEKTEIWDFVDSSLPCLD